MFPTVHGVVSQGGEGGGPPPAGRRAIVNYETDGQAFGSTNGSAGWSFTPSTDILVTHVHALMGLEREGSILNLSRRSDSALLIAQAFDAAVDVWVDVPLSAPVTLTADTEYVIWVYHPTQSVGRYIRSDVSETVEFDPVITYGVGLLRSSKGIPQTEYENQMQALLDFSFVPAP